MDRVEGWQLGRSGATFPLNAVMPPHQPGWFDATNQSVSSEQRSVRIASLRAVSRAEDRARQEQTKHRAEQRVRIEEETSHAVAPIVHLLRNGSEGLKPEKLHALQAPAEEDRCSGCFESIGEGAVMFPCGHVFCNRMSCVSSCVQNCPDCQVAVTSRKTLFGHSVGLDLAVTFQEGRGSLESWRRWDAGATDQGEDGDLSFEVGQDEASGSENDPEQDRVREGHHQPKRTKVYTFEIEPASVHDVRDGGEWRQESSRVQDQSEPPPNLAAQNLPTCDGGEREIENKATLVAEQAGVGQQTQSTIPSGKSADPVTKQGTSFKSFFGWGRKKAAKETTETDANTSTGCLGLPLGTGKQDASIVPGAAPAKDTKAALARIAAASSLLANDGECTQDDHIAVLQDMPIVIELLKKQENELKSSILPFQLRAEIGTGLQQAQQLITKCRDSLSNAAQESTSSCRSFVAQNNFVEAIAQARRAVSSFAALGQVGEVDIWGFQLAVLQARQDAQNRIDEGMRLMKELSFRTARRSLAEAGEILAKAPPYVTASGRELPLQSEFQDAAQEVTKMVGECENSLKELGRKASGYWHKAQRLQSENTPEAQSKACLLYTHCVKVFADMEENRAATEAQRLQQITFDNVVSLALKEAEHYMAMNQYDEGISLCDWLLAWLDFNQSPNGSSKAMSVKQGLHAKRAGARLQALTSICDEGIRQFARGYMKGMQELKKVEHDFACSHDSGVLTPEETTILTALSDRMSTLTRLSEKWTEAEKSDPRKSYDHRLGALRTVKNELAAEKGLASERLLWDVNNFLQRIIQQRKYQPETLDAQKRADEVFEQAQLEIRNLRAQMQRTFDDAQDKESRDRIVEMARACRVQLTCASDTYSDSEAFEKKQAVDKMLADVDFELERWTMRQDDLAQLLKEAAEGRRVRARSKLEREAVERTAGSELQEAEVSAENVSREILRADGARTIEFGRHEEGRLDFARAQMLYTQACDLLRGVDDEGESRAQNALDSLVDREAEMAEMLALSNTAARGLFEQRADMLCRQARDRPQEKHGGPSIEQFDASVASNPPAVMRESVMGSYGARMVFRPSFDPEPMPVHQRHGGTTHAVNNRPLQERLWLHTESLGNPTPGQIACSKFTQSLAPAVPTTKANLFARPMANLSAGLVNAPESEQADYRVMPTGPADKPRRHGLDRSKF